MAEPLERQADSLNLPRKTEAFKGDLCFVLLALALVSLRLALLLDATPLWLMAVAAVLTVVVWRNPQEAAPAAILFLFCASVILPVAVIDVPAQTPTEMYYWAGGLFLITGAAVARLGSRVFRIPNSAKGFFAVSMLAAVYGLAQGISVGYVARQLYGILLLIAYLALAIHLGTEKLLVRRIQTYGFLCALLFFVYYIVAFAQYGIEKQANPAGPEAALLSTVLLTSAVVNRNFLRAVVALILLVIPALLLSRSALLTPFVATILTIAICAKSKTAKVFSYLVAAGLGLIGTLPPVANIAGDIIRLIFGSNSIVPEEIFHADSLLGRAMQMVSALATARVHPLLGAGLGSNIEWFEPASGWMSAAFVDNGWAYLLAKMGVAGLVTFLWFLATVFRHVARQTAALSACLLTVTLVTMFSQASYFHFTQAPLMGTIAGLLLAKDYRRTA